MRETLRAACKKLESNMEVLSIAALAVLLLAYGYLIAAYEIISE